MPIAHSRANDDEIDAPDPFGPLNDGQRAAASHGEARGGRVDAGPLLIIAGAGTGKTATIAHRVAHLVRQGVAPERILLLTFSRRAADEMTRRARALLGGASGPSGPAALLPWAGTFHSIGARLLRQYASRIGLAPDFGILDRADSADLIDWLRDELGLSRLGQRFPRKDTCLSIYSHRVNTGWPLARVLDEQFPWCAEWQVELGTLFRRYVQTKQAQAVLDYDDLLLWWHAALTDPAGGAALATDIGARFDHLLVDEYQDTNALQAAILLALRPDGRGLAVVGDDAQSIYSFRAADISNILEFPARFQPPARTVVLDTSYRSVQSILDAANALMADSPRAYRKTLRAARGPGGRPRLVTVLDDRAQVDHVVAEVLRVRESGLRLRDQAVLFRTSHHSDLLEVELLRRGIPFVKYGGLKFLEAAHVKDVLAVLRWADQPRHAIAAFRVLQLPPGIGPSGARRMYDRMQREGGGFATLAAMPVPGAARDVWTGLVTLLSTLAAPDARWSGQIDRVLDWYQPVLEHRHDGAAVRAADLRMLATIARQFGSRQRFLAELTLDPPQAAGDLAGPPARDEDYLNLATVHSAKGQEWAHVYLLNVADGNFPNEFATGTPDGIEEERRLLYVAMTRARDSLQLIEPQRYYVTRQPRLGAGYVHGARSRFLTSAVLACLDAGPDETNAAMAMSVAEPVPPASIGPAIVRSPGVGGSAPGIDAAAAVRSMW